MLCEESNSPVKRSGGERRVGSRSGSLGGGREPIFMSVWLALEQAPSSSCCLLSRSGKRPAGAAIVLSIRRHPGVAVEVDWGGGGAVSSLVAKDSTTIKDVWGYIVILGMWICVVVGRKG